MDIRGIKLKANLIYIKYRQQIIPEFFYVGYVSLLAQYLQSGFFSFFVSLFLCPVAHGYVKCSMKLVDEDNAHIDYHESMVGVIDFVRVAPAYLMRKAIILFFTILAMLPSLLMINNVIPQFSLEILGNSFIQTEFFLPDFMQTSLLLDHYFILFNLIVCVLFYLFLNALFMPVPYVMELEEFSWSESITYSVRFMKGNMIHYFRLYMTYFFRHACYWVGTGILLMIIGSINEILMLFCMVFSLFIYIEVFKGRFEIAKYLFYKEIRGDKDERNQGD